MGIGMTLVAVAVIAVVGLIFYDEVSSGIGSFFSDQEAQALATELDIKPATPQTPICDLAITIKGELEHDFFGTILQGGVADLDFQFGENTFFPQVAEWQFINCQGNFQIASFFPRLSTNIQILQEGGSIGNTELTTNQLTALSVVDNEQLLFSGDEQQVRDQLFTNFQLTIDDLQTNDLILIWDEVYDLELKIKSVNNSVNFRECSTFNPELCQQIIFKAGIVEEPATFSKTFLIKKLSLEEYNIEIKLPNQKINDMPPSVPFIYNVRFG